MTSRLWIFRSASLSTQLLLLLSLILIVTVVEVVMEGLRWFRCVD